MKVQFWGTRGSIPSPGKTTMELGGNTSCVQLIFDDDQSLILDAGTGIIALASASQGRTVIPQSVGEHHIVITHFHWDHILGFSFFHPIYYPGNQVQLHSAFPSHVLEENVRALFDGTYSPIQDLDQLPATIRFHQIPESGSLIAGARVRHMQAAHAETSYVVRVEHGRHAVGYAVNHEGGSSATNEAVVEFMRGVDVLIHDACFTAEQYFQREGWGHSTIEQAIENAIRVGASQVHLTHHAPNHSDDFLRLYLRNLLKKQPKLATELEIHLAREGHVVSL